MTISSTHKYESLKEAAEESRAWLLGPVAPLWVVQKCGDGFLFPEQISAGGNRDNCPHRLRVQARHIYSYCMLGRLGWQGPWEEMVRGSAEFLLRRGRRSDGLYVHYFDADGKVLDSRADLYDQAFVLLALAHAGSLAGGEHFIAAAEALDATLESRWRLSGGNYFEGEVVTCPPCRQNPHMHLLESFIALEKVTGAARWRRKAEHLANLCVRYFIDASTGVLTEYFNTNLNPAAGDEGRIVEPGHCFEWAWLFEKLALLGKAGAGEISDGLTDFARRYGIDRSRGVAINELLVDGTVRSAHARLWPQTERLKAALARLCRTGHDEERQEALDAYAGLTKYFNVPLHGTWRDKLMADGSWVDEPAPGSSLYHIVCALAELSHTATLL